MKLLKTIKTSCSFFTLPSIALFFNSCCFIDLSANVFAIIDKNQQNDYQNEWKSKKKWISRQQSKAEAEPRHNNIKNEKKTIESSNEVTAKYYINEHSENHTEKWSRKQSSSILVLETERERGRFTPWNMANRKFEWKKKLVNANH